MTNRFRFPLLAAGFFGLTGVALGALCAHALATTLAERGMTHAWDTGARYHIFHAMALLAAAAWLRASNTRADTRMIWAVRCWTLGTVLFSGSLYGLALGGPRWLGPVTPLGGIVLMGGWLFVIAAALAKEE
ncbi:MAG: DUF423 domain-containing protein [Opitutus sp.]|nr:DUF423 domain-containing protein [Opitutus sp.]